MKNIKFNLTNRCNLKCKHCYLGKNKQTINNILNINDIIIIFNKLLEKGVKSITLQGGEVTKYTTNLIDILEIAGNINLNINISTNLLEYEYIEPLLSKKALKKLIISLDGTSSLTHDFLRGKNSFNKTMNNLNILMKNERVINRELLVLLSFVLNKKNQKEVGDIVYLADEYKIDCLYVRDVKFNKDNFLYIKDLKIGYYDLLNAYCILISSWLIKNNIALDLHIPMAFSVFLKNKFNINYTNNIYNSCPGADEYAYIDMYGNLLPCENMLLINDNKSLIFNLIDDSNLIKNDINRIRKSYFFNKFNRIHQLSNFDKNIYPCNYCKFNEVCKPCFEHIFRNQRRTNIPICAALIKYGDSFCDNYKQKVFNLNLAY